MRQLSKEAFGTTPATFEAAMEKALYQEENTMKKSYLMKVLILATVFLMLTCTALAVGLNQSARHTATLQAREAVMEAYGLTSETIGMLFEHTEQGQDGYTVVYSPIKYGNQIGEYTVHVDKDGNAKVSWSHDGVDMDSLDIGSPAWGQAQLLEIMEIESQHNEWRGDTKEMTEEELAATRLQRQAERDSILADMREKGVEVGIISVAPKEGDLTEEEAVQAAKDAAMATYGMEESFFDDHEVFISLYQNDNDAEAFYRVQLVQDLPDVDYVERSQFFIELGATSREVRVCSWDIKPENRTLPQGPLDGYDEAVRSFIEKGAFATLTPEEKADVAQRMAAAGFADLLPHSNYAAPTADDLPQADAIAAADKAMTDTYGFTPKTLSLFAHSTAVVETEGKRLWTVDYVPELKERDKWLFEEPMGTYTVSVDAQTGELAEAEWSLQAERGDTVYTESTFGASPAWDAEMLTWAIRLDEKRQVLIEKYDRLFEEMYPVAPSWSLEDSGTYDGWMRDAGFDPAEYNNGLPREGDLTLEQVTEIAIAAVVQEYGVDSAMLADAPQQPYYWITDPEKPVWAIRFFTGWQDSYTVTMDAATGEIVNTEFIATGNG